MVREIVVPENNTYLLKLPDEMVGKQVEVIAFEVKERIIHSKKTIKELKGFFDKYAVDIPGFKFNREEANDYD